MTSPCQKRIAHFAPRTGQRDKKNTPGIKLELINGEDPYEMP